VGRQEEHQEEEHQEEEHREVERPEVGHREVGHRAAVAQPSLVPAPRELEPLFAWLFQELAQLVRLLALLLQLEPVLA
jgi:hypothetical protein